MDYEQKVMAIVASLLAVAFVLFCMSMVYFGKDSKECEYYKKKRSVSYLWSIYYECADDDFK